MPTKTAAMTDIVLLAGSCERLNRIPDSVVSTAPWQLPLRFFPIAVLSTTRPRRRPIPRLHLQRRVRNARDRCPMWLRLTYLVQSLEHLVSSALFMDWSLLSGSTRQEIIFLLQAQVSGVRSIEGFSALRFLSSSFVDLNATVSHQREMVLIIGLEAGPVMVSQRFCQALPDSLEHSIAFAKVYAASCLYEP